MKIFFRKSRNAKKCYAKKEKPFWFSSLGQQVQFGVILKFCRTFGRTILVTSGVSKKKHSRKAISIVDSFLKKSAY